MKYASNTFYLVRHAHADFTPGENRPLSKKGKEDAEKVAETLQQFPIKSIYSSPYKRAYQTIEPFAQQLKLPIQIEPNLRERKLSGEPVEDFFKTVEATWQDFSFSHPGGESNTAAQKRGLNVVNRLQEQNQKRYIVLSTHGNLLALILNGFDSSINFNFWKSLTMPDIFKLTFSKNDQVEILRLWQDIG